MARIALTTTHPEQHGNYERWLRRLAPESEILFITRTDEVIDTLPTCDGLLLPGGGDPDPLLYGRQALRPLCDIDDARDAIEIAAIRTAVHARMPILGICRGLQIMNVALGGTLIADLSSSGFEGHHRITDEDRLHDVQLESDSMLARITGEIQGEVNSAHHQGVDIVAPRLRVTARSADNLPEALEWNDPHDKPFLLCLHWHPERLAPAHVLGDSIGRAFLQAIAEQ
ncbi:gamma-glutamyl-gamma-aminobutyrate hydrolase family protein [bacterium]|nr:gamma-glutamyl-gamma-aminobutyrate hydrolase family protein [bacterium]